MRVWSRKASTNPLGLFPLYLSYLDVFSISLLLEIERAYCVLHPCWNPESNGDRIPAINLLNCSLMIHSNILDKAGSYRTLLGL